LSSYLGPRATIVGGGIGGLSTALALRRASISVTIFERQDQLREIGSGLTLWTNAVKVLRQLDLEGALQAISAPLERFEFWSWRGKLLGTLPLRQYSERLGAPSVGVHRADLLALLARALEDCPIVLSAQCVGFAHHSKDVTARFADGRTATGDLLIGADGLYSTIRAQVVGAQPPRYAGYTCWRGVTTFAHEAVSPGITSETLGCGTRFGMLPIGQGRVFWYASANTSANGDDRLAGHKRTVLELFRAFRPPIVSLIEATDEAAILRHDIYDRPPIQHWGANRVTLVGDAAHPPTPNQGQGACQAIEDALALARCLDNGSAIDTAESINMALRRYEALRRKRPPASSSNLVALAGSSSGAIHWHALCVRWRCAP